jgi:putative peptide zinc metalloprotease protein
MKALRDLYGLRAVHKTRGGYLGAFLAVTAALVVVGVFALLGRPETTTAGDADNVAVAVNTKDGKSVYKVRIAIRRENGDIVSSTNAAVAYASCTDCQTTAIAFEVLLITNNASVIMPTNLAIAINENCSGCETIAQAYQFIQSTDGQVRFTKDGSKRLADIRHELHALRKSDLTADELQTSLDALANQIADILAHELVAA